MYSVMVADPPWPFGDRLPGPARGAAKHYQTMSIEDIVEFPLPEMADNATLFLWRVSAMQQEALHVMESWGFTLKSELIWLKRTPNGKRWFGMGRTVRAEHETCLIGTRGKPVTLDKSVRSTFEAVAGRHSEKPEEFFKIVERLRAGPYVELFSRKTRDGWTCWGDEVTDGTE